MVKAQLTNGVSWGFTFDAEDTSDTREVEFVGVTGNKVDYPMAVVCTNATFTEDDGVYTITPSASGRVDIVAQRAREL